MGVVTAALAAAAISAGAQTGPETPEVVITQPATSGQVELAAVEEADPEQIEGE